MSNSLDPDQARRFIGPDLITNSVSKGYQQKKGKHSEQIYLVVSDACPCECFAYHGSIIKAFVSSGCQWVMDHLFMFYFVRRGVVDKLLALYTEVPGVPGSTSLSDET